MISICMATYNGEKYLTEQIDSILVRLGPDDELIISDDHLTDRTREIVLSYNDHRIILVGNELKKGVIYNFDNVLMRHHLLDRSR